MNVMPDSPMGKSGNLFHRRDDSPMDEILSTGFMADLTYEGCQQIGMPSLLSINEETLESNTIEQVLTGSKAKDQKSAQKKMKKQLKYTLGDIKDIPTDSMLYKSYDNSDKGYMIQLESENEQKFLTNNFYL